MTDISEGDSEGIISNVNLAEFHRAVNRASSEEEADIYVSWIRESRISIVPLEEETALLASLKKQQYAKSRSPFAWGDAFCLATAMSNDADILITSDDEFDKVTDIPILKV